MPLGTRGRAEDVASVELAAFERPEDGKEVPTVGAVSAFLATCFEARGGLVWPIVLMVPLNVWPMAVVVFLAVLAKKRDALLLTVSESMSKDNDAELGESGVGLRSRSLGPEARDVLGIFAGVATVSIDPGFHFSPICDSLSRRITPLSEFVDWPLRD